MQKVNLGLLNPTLFYILQTNSKPMYYEDSIGFYVFHANKKGSA